MKRVRFTLGELILMVVVVAIGLAAIRSGSPAWAGAMLSITFFAMICSLLGVILGRGTRRVYWSGFGLLGWSYLLLMYVPWLHENVGQFLLAPNLFEYLDEVLHADPQGGGGRGGGLASLPLGVLGASATGGGFTGPSGAGAFSDLVRIGMAMEALLWAFLGGWVACYFASGRDREGPSETAARTAAPEPDELARGQRAAPGGASAAPQSQDR
jgi:hypothetical protein